VAIIMCIVCSGVGALIIGPWYLVRLMQWNSLARKYPALLERAVARHRIEARFQSAKIKMLIGIGFGVVIFLMVLFVFILPIALAEFRP
jgi:hypothetical protein